MIWSVKKVGCWICKSLYMVIFRLLYTEVILSARINIHIILEILGKTFASKIANEQN